MRQAGLISGDPIKGYGAAVVGTEALSPEFDVRTRTKERGKDSLYVSIPANKRVRMIREVKGFECRKEGVFSSSDDFQGGVRRKIV